MFFSKNRYFFYQLVENLKNFFSSCKKPNFKYLRQKGLVLGDIFKENNSFVSTQCPMKHNYTAFVKILTGIYPWLLCFGGEQLRNIFHPGLNIIGNMLYTTSKHRKNGHKDSTSI